MVNFVMLHTQNNNFCTWNLYIGRCIKVFMPKCVHSIKVIVFIYHSEAYNHISKTRILLTLDIRESPVY